VLTRASREGGRSGQHVAGGAAGGVTWHGSAACHASKAVSHHTVQEIWYVVAGAGEMWRRQEGRESVVALRPGVCLTIPLGTTFQFRSSEGAQPLEVVAVTMPPWPAGGDEARPEDGPWRPALRR
jgi:mannose-6-phosphate isomerase-like protein (cupin superfamily)